MLPNVSDLRFVQAILTSQDQDDQIYPAGRHVPQTSGEPSMGLPQWIEENSNESIEDTDVVVYHTFGVDHFPSPEDFPVMPRESMTVLLKPRNFFTRNPALDVAPTYCSTPSQIAANKAALVDNTDTRSQLV